MVTGNAHQPQIPHIQVKDLLIATSLGCFGGENRRGNHPSEDVCSTGNSTILRPHFQKYWKTSASDEVTLKSTWKIGPSVLANLMHRFCHVSSLWNVRWTLFFSCLLWNRSFSYRKYENWYESLERHTSSICRKCCLFLYQTKIYHMTQLHGIFNSKTFMPKGLSNHRAKHTRNHRLQPKERNLSCEHSYVHFQPKANHLLQTQSS